MTELENFGYLEDELDKRTEEILDKLPEEVMEIIYDNLLQGIYLEEGDVAPDFCLQDTNNELVSSIDLPAKGPLVVTFFQGKWCPL
jgi:hypothetical protein